ncbi:uncharacterized protein LOC126796704 [Argentina anserina]|uniref:uncharacterized protein LOC126796704 n=1 Tax=Argentina anserina TaxID=57926 RepID=UPI0021764135|nr:uncharacterized protein LOC126796704 [Potentilla anserina]
MSSKRFGRSKLLREGYRKSPRLSALEDLKASGTRFGAIAGSTSTQQMKSYLGYEQGPASKTRARKKRRLAPQDGAAYLSRSSSPNLGPVTTSQEDNQTSSDPQVVWPRKDIRKPASTDQQSSALSALWLPEKRILELVLDILQRRDTYDIFAEPVNRSEVPDYYDIIEEPMDFGTMRAKLHEGMYKNLQQFEHDAFLVTENAMHFNPSVTIYFRQARSIHELVKEVFHILNTYPEKLESDFLEARQRTVRRAQVEVGKPDSCPKVATDMNPFGMMIGGSSKAVGFSLNGTSNTRRAPAQTGGTCIGTGVQKRLSGAKDDGRSRSFEADRRYTYRPWNYFPSQIESTGLTLSSDLRQLEHVNHQDIDYRESLISFVRDLGPTAKMIARKKLLGCLQQQKSRFPLAYTCAERAPSTTSLVAAPSQGGHPAIMKTTRTTFQLPSSGDQSNSHSAFYQNHRNEISQLDSYPLKAHNGDRSCIATGLQSSGNNEIHQLDSYPLKAYTGDRSCIAAESQSTGNKSTAMILNRGKLPNHAESFVAVSDSESNVLRNRNLEVASLSKNSCTYKLTPAPVKEDDEPKAAQGQSHKIRTLSHMSHVLKPDRFNPLSQQFTFDLPYWRAQLGKISSSGHEVPYWRTQLAKVSSSGQEQFLQNGSKC